MGRNSYKNNNKNFIKNKKILFLSIESKAFKKYLQ